MAFTLAEFTRLRSFAYHVTDRANLPGLVARPALEPAAALLARAGAAGQARERRDAPTPVRVDGRTVVLKDQRPLILANAELAPAWGPGDFIEHLNGHVFFWPGDGRGPVKHGERLLAVYAPDSPTVLRIPTADLLAANPAREPLFCPFNSGAPRKQAGRPVPRGPDLFTPAGAFPRRASDVVELVFHGAVALPQSTQVRAPGGAWVELGAAAI